MPDQGPDIYEGACEEHLAVRRSLGVLDRSDRGRLAVSGGDRVTFLERLVSNGVAGLPPGGGTEALLLFPKGKLFSDLTIYRLADRFLVETPPERREAVFGRLDGYVLSSDVEVRDETEEFARLGVHGPRALEVVSELAGGEVPPELFATVPGRVAGAEALLCRVGYLGEDGVDLHVPAGAAAEVLALLGEAGAVRVGRAAAESLRVEAGLPRFGAELTEEVLPPEVPSLLERAVSTTKGCFVGQETLARIRTYGHVNRELRGLVIHGEAPPAPGAGVTAGGERVGVVTSSAAPPTRDHPVALAFLRRGHLETGTEVGVEGSRATVVPPGRWS